MTIADTPDTAMTTLATLRAMVQGILLFGLVGTVSELVLIDHDEDPWQLIPLFVVAFAIAATAWMVLRRREAMPLAANIFRAAMVLLIVSGGLGAVLHYRANMEFKLEMDPSIGGFALFESVIRAKAPPSLAPGTLAVFGLFGLATTFRRDSRMP